MIPKVKAPVTNLSNPLLNSNNSNKLYYIHTYMYVHTQLLITYLFSTLSHQVPAKRARPVKTVSYNLYYHTNHFTLAIITYNEHPAVPSWDRVTVSNQSHVLGWDYGVMFEMCQKLCVLDYGTVLHQVTLPCALACSYGDPEMKILEYNILLYTLCT